MFYRTFICVIYSLMRGCNDGINCTMQEKDLSINNELFSETKCFRIYPDNVVTCLKPRIYLYLAIALNDLFVKHSAQVIINSHNGIFGNFRKKNGKSSFAGGIRIQANSILIIVDFHYLSR
jgi:hypothetical protein